MAQRRGANKARRRGPVPGPACTFRMLPYPAPRLARAVSAEVSTPHSTAFGASVRTSLARRLPMLPRPTSVAHSPPLVIKFLWAYPGCRHTAFAPKFPQCGGWYRPPLIGALRLRARAHTPVSSAWPCAWRMCCSVHLIAVAHVCYRNYAPAAATAHDPGGSPQSWGSPPRRRTNSASNSGRRASSRLKIPQPHPGTKQSPRFGWLSQKILHPLVRTQPPASPLPL